MTLIMGPGIVESNDMLLSNCNSDQLHDDNTSNMHHDRTVKPECLDSMFSGNTDARDRNRLSNFCERTVNAACVTTSNKEVPLPGTSWTETSI